MIRTLELPWGVSDPNVQYWKSKKVHVYRGRMLPPHLQKYASQDFSYHRWIEDEMNGSVLPPEKAAHRFTPREHQVSAAKQISQAFDNGWRGFLEADETGLGKTLSTLAAMCVIAKNQGFASQKRAKLLVVCPKGVIPVWRQTLQSYPVSSALLRVMVINYQQLSKLMSQPAQAKTAKKHRTKNTQTAKHGTPTVDWDYIIFDEAQYLKNYPTSTTSLFATSIAKLNETYVKSRTPFVVYSTATPGSTPLNLSVMSGLIAPLISNSAKTTDVTPHTWGAFLANNSFHVKQNTKKQWTWIANPSFGKNSNNADERRKYEQNEKIVKDKQRKDSRRIGKALLSNEAPFLKRAPSDIAGWPEQQLIPFPVELTPKQEPLYQEAWSRFRAWLRLPGSKKDSKSAMVESLRYRQKSSMLKVDAMASVVQNFVNSGHQVYISCEFMDTIDKYREAFDTMKIPYAEVSGRVVAERENERMKFQKGQAHVVLCSVVAGVSFHAEESLSDNTTATSQERITIIHDIRSNDLDADQTLGRAHRDGKNSLTYFPYFVHTIDEKVIKGYTNKRANAKSMMGASSETSEELENLFLQAAVEDDN